MKTYRGIKPLKTMNSDQYKTFGALLIGAFLGVAAVRFFSPYFRKQATFDLGSYREEDTDFEETQTPLDRRFADRTRDEVEEASWESFPASDPPAW